MKITAGSLGGTLPDAGGLVGKVYVGSGGGEIVTLRVLETSLGDATGVRRLVIGEAAEVQLHFDAEPLTWKGLQAQFGRNAVDAEFDDRYDLNQDGVIGFQDFLLFSQTR